MGRFITQKRMAEIRRDVAVANSALRRGETMLTDGQGQKVEVAYISLHAWGCGCCFIFSVAR
jgi:hypothetical protein